MAKMSRVSLARKRQLQEPDRFVAFMQTTGQFLTAHRRSVAAGVSAFLLLVVIGSVVFYLHQKSEKEAFYRLSAVMNRVAADQEQKPAAQQERFHAIYTNHDNSLAGQIAALKYADTCYQTGKTVAAIETYRDLVEKFKQPLFKNLALEGLGYAYEAAGQYREAARTFERLLNTPGAIFKDKTLFNMARMYERLGKKKKSRSLFARLTSDYPDSLYAPLARMYTSS